MGILCRKWNGVKWIERFDGVREEERMTDNSYFVLYNFIELSSNF